jgi:hypothetical protein
MNATCRRAGAAGRRGAGRRNRWRHIPGVGNARVAPAARRDPGRCRVAIVWPCPLAVDAYAAAGPDLGFPRPDCPSCAPGRSSGIQGPDRRPPVTGGGRVAAHGQLGVDGADAGQDRRADGRAGPGQGQAGEQLTPGAIQLGGSQRSHVVGTHQRRQASSGACRVKHQAEQPPNSVPTNLDELAINDTGLGQAGFGEPRLS